MGWVDEGHKGLRAASGRLPGTELTAGAFTPALMLRVQGGLMISAPHPPFESEAGVSAVLVATLIGGLALELTAAKAPAWLVHVNPALCMVGITIGLVFVGDAVGPYTLFYLWVVTICTFFFSIRESALQILFAVLNFGVVLFLVGFADPQAPSLEHGAVMGIGTLAVTSVALLGLRTRVDLLVDRLTDAARTDPLTELWNRTGLRDALEAELERARHGDRAEHRISIFVLDLDHFQEINNRWGHPMGDRILREIGDLLTSATRRIDSVGRSGEEFTVLLPETGKHEAYALAERVLSALRSTRLGSGPPLTASVGVASYPDDAADADGLLNAADHALYSAKILGRDRAVVFSDEVATVVTAHKGGRRSGADEDSLELPEDLAQPKPE
jgi:diguanylate cyclase (GGDEF)-like protein